MGLFGNIFGGAEAIHCDEEDFLIWKYPHDKVKKGNSVNVRDGEVAVLIGSSQKVVEGPSVVPVEENLSELFYINIAGSNVVKFVIPRCSITDPRFPDLPVPVSIHGSVNFGIQDARAFIRMHRLSGFNMEAFQKKIQDATVTYIKSIVTRVPQDCQIPLVQMETKILEIAQYVHQLMKPRLENDFAVNLRAVDLSMLHVHTEDDNYEELRSLTQAHTTEVSEEQHKINMDTMRAQHNINMDTMRTQHNINMDTMSTHADINLETLRAQSELNIESMKEIQSQDLNNRRSNLQMERQERANKIEDEAETMRLKRELGAKAYSAQIDEMQKSGRMAMGGMPGGVGQPMSGINPSGINQIGAPSPIGQIGQPQGLNMGGGINKGGGLNMGGTPTPPPMSGAPQMPPQMPQVSVYVAIGGQQQGPFDHNMLKQMIQNGGLTAQTLVWKEGLTAWTPAGQVPEVASILNAPQVPPTPSSMPPGVPPTL